MTICSKCGAEHVAWYGETWLDATESIDGARIIPARRRIRPVETHACPVVLDRIRALQDERMVYAARLIVPATARPLPELRQVVPPSAMHARFAAAVARALRWLARRPQVAAQQVSG